MVESTQAAEVRANLAAGHLSVHVDSDHPVDVPFLFEQPQKHLAPAAAASFGSHLGLVLIVVLLMRYAPPQVIHPPVMLDETNANIVWLSQPGPGGGGGGGGNRMKEPPRQAELPGKDKLTVPVEQKPQLEQQAKVEPNPIEQLNIPAKDLASALDSIPGAIEGPPTFSQG